MNRLGKIFRSDSRLLKAMAAATVFLFLSLLVFAASPELHEAIHADAKDAHHHCAITLLAQGQMDAPSGNTFAEVPTVFIEAFSPVKLFVPGTTLELLPPGRAPPSVS